MNLDKRQIIILAIVFIVLGIIIYIVSKIMDRQAGGIQNVPDTEDSQAVRTGNALTEAEKATAAKIASAIFNDIDGVNFTHDYPIYNLLLALNDAQIVEVWNVWDRKYKAKFGNMNLIDSLLDEMTSDHRWITFLKAFGTRLSRINAEHGTHFKSQKN